MAEPPPKAAAHPLPGERVVRRVSLLIPLFGLSAGVLAGLLRHWDWAEGLFLGSALAWLNFHWMKRGIWAFTVAATAAENGGEKRQPSAATYLAAVFRYALIGLALYVIFRFLHVSLVSLAVGLCAFAAAIITATVWEIIQSVQ